eukprot:4275486-Amphidinium_carterae.1
MSEDESVIQPDDDTTGDLHRELESRRQAMHFNTVETLQEHFRSNLIGDHGQCSDQAEMCTEYVVMQGVQVVLVPSVSSSAWDL